MTVYSWIVLWGVLVFVAYALYALGTDPDEITDLIRKQNKKKRRGRRHE